MSDTQESVSLQPCYATTLQSNLEQIIQFIFILCLNQNLFFLLKEKDMFSTSCLDVFMITNMAGKLHLLNKLYFIKEETASK